MPKYCVVRMFVGEASAEIEAVDPKEALAKFKELADEAHFAPKGAPDEVDMDIEGLGVQVFSMNEDGVVNDSDAVLEEDF